MEFKFNPQTVGDWGTFVGAAIAFISAIVALITWPYKTFITHKQARRIYLMRLEDDGSTQYVRKEDFDRLYEEVKEANEGSRKWQKIAEDWIRNP